MEIWKSIIVGVVQGLAEFLPISSSGHIVLTQFLLGINQDGILFEVILHLGTLLSVILYFWKSLWNMTKSLWTPSMKQERYWILFLILATMPAIAAKLTGISDTFEAAYNNPVLVSGLLLVTGALLLAPKVIKTKEKNLTWKTALFMGIGQAIAILPGISRSGSTITAGLISGVNPKKAAEFAFLMSLPAILGAVVLKLDAFAELKDNTELLTSFIVGAIAAFISGIFAIYFVMDAVKKGKLEYFAYYCFAAGILGMIYFQFFYTAP